MQIIFTILLLQFWNAQNKNNVKIYNCYPLIEATFYILHIYIF